MNDRYAVAITRMAVRGGGRLEVLPFASLIVRVSMSMLGDFIIHKGATVIMDATRLVVGGTGYGTNGITFNGASTVVLRYFSLETYGSITWIIDPSAGSLSAFGLPNVNVTSSAVLMGYLFIKLADGYDDTNLDDRDYILMSLPSDRYDSESFSPVVGFLTFV
jgi:hypothetical protein